jgi:hypothetical protein
MVLFQIRIASLPDVAPTHAAKLETSSAFLCEVL